MLLCVCIDGSVIRRKELDSSQLGQKRSGASGGGDFKDFEMYVSFLYESLGFRVTRNIVIEGQEIDVLAERFVPGVGNTRIVVECKWRRSGSVSNQEVYDFITMIGSLRIKNLATRGVMVSNVHFSPRALSATNTLEDVALLRIAELEDQLFSLHLIFQTAVEAYERSLIFNTYIPVRASWRDAYRARAETTDDTEATLDEWVRSGSVNFISVLGDYGTGKTTLLNRLRYKYAYRYLRGESSIIPLFLPLKRFYAHDTLAEFLRHALISELEREIPLAVFWRFLSDGRFLILLDGFDEMAAEVDVDKRSENFLLLAPLLQSRSKTILTCRPSYFISTSEYEGMISLVNREDEPLGPTFNHEPHSSDYITRSFIARRLKYKLLSQHSGYEPLRPFSPIGVKVIELEYFDERQIDQFLAKHDAEYRLRFGSGWEQVKEFLLGIYDLSDLMSRPILLTMINDTVLDARMGVGSSVNALGPSSLYEIYTSMKLDMDWLKGESRRLLKKKDRYLIAETIAVAMFLDGKMEIAYSSLLAMAEKGVDLPAEAGYLRDIRPAVVVADIQVSTFLTRSEDEMFRFSHKSFMEFFVAAYVKKKIVNGQVHEKILDTYIPKEILYFLGAFSIPEPPLKEALLGLFSRRGDRSATFARNVAAAILYSGPRHEGLELEGVEVSDFELRKTIFVDPAWRRVRFVRARWREIEMAEGELVSVSFTKSNIEDWGVEGGSYDFDLVDSDLLDASFNGAEIVVRSRLARIKSSMFSNGQVRISGAVAVLESEYDKSLVEIGVARGGRISFEKCRFSESVVRRSAGQCLDSSLLSFSESLFKRCGIFGIHMGKREVKSLNLFECEGVIIYADAAGDNIEEVNGGRLIIVSRQAWENRRRRYELLESCRRQIREDWREMIDELAHE